MLFRSEINLPEDPQLIRPLVRIHNGNPDAANQSYKLLGVYFDEFLSFDKHICFIAAKLTKSNYIIKRCVNILSSNSLKLLYYSLVHPHLLYCNFIFGCSSQKNIKRLAILQKKAIRSITKSKIHDHTVPLFKSLKILPLEQLIYQNKLHIMHSVFYNYASNSINTMFTRRVNENLVYDLRNDHDFTVPFARIELFKRFPAFSFSTC